MDVVYLLYTYFVFFFMPTRIVTTIAIATCVIAFFILIGYIVFVHRETNRATDALGHSFGSGCNIAYIPLRGDMVTYNTGGDSTSSSVVDNGYAASEDITLQIRAATTDSSIDAIILAIDSGGGDPVAGEEIEMALKRSHKPTVALIRSQGDSAAYMAATGADTIVASAFSDVGSIGVTASYSDTAKQDVKDGLTFHQLSTGKFKDMFNPAKNMTDEEKALILKQMQQYFGHFIDMVATNRHLDRATVVNLADGSSMTGDDALKNGLIDSIGSIDDVRSVLSKKIGHDAIICGIDDIITE